MLATVSCEQGERDVDVVKMVALRSGLAINSHPRGTETRILGLSGIQHKRGATLSEAPCGSGSVVPGNVHELVSSIVKGVTAEGGNTEVPGVRDSVQLP